MRTLLKLAALTGLAACLASCGHSTKNSTDKNASPTDSNNPTTTQITTDNSSALTDCQKKLQNIKTVKECTSKFKKLMNEQPPYCDPQKASCITAVAKSLHTKFKNLKALEPTCQTAANSGDSTSDLNYSFLLMQGAMGTFNLSTDQIEKIFSGDETPPKWAFDKNACMYATESLIPACTMKSQCNDTYTSTMKNAVEYLFKNKPAGGYVMSDSFYHAISVCCGPKTDEVVQKLQQGAQAERTWPEHIDIDTKLFIKKGTKAGSN
jgi:hypothetical protein